MKKWLVLAGLVVLGTAVIGWLLWPREATRSPVSAEPTPIVGFITKVSVESISIKTDRNQEFTFKNDVPNVSVDHLREHLDLKEAVSVTWYAEGDAKIATFVDDVP